ncbi:MAG: DNRLRE domain-containing protein [Candidatus Hadarchaeota archaeon]|nr:DNRLRE domain-containing protein [Candidatus Hadarchaeota archaeon]
MKKFSMPLLAVVLLTIATGACASLYIVSDTLTDRIDVISTSREIMSIEYVDGEELGGTNKEVLEGEWEEFGVRLINNSPETADPWENVLIRVKFYGIENEYIYVEYVHDNAWQGAVVYDLGTLEAGEIGGVADVGPGGGWTVKTQTEENFRLRVKFEKAAENVDVKIYAIDIGVEPDTYIAEVNDPGSIKIVNPAQDAYICQNHPSINYGDEDYLELATRMDANAYVLLRFDSTDIPDELGKAELYLFQYWGTGFSDLGASGVTVQLYPVTENWDENVLTWGTMPAHGENLISEGVILGTGKWYIFDLTDYISGLEAGEDASMLVKFSEDGFDNAERRIRFRSTASEERAKHPHLRVKS